MRGMKTLRRFGASAGAQALLSMAAWVYGRWAHRAGLVRIIAAGLLAAIGIAIAWPGGSKPASPVASGTPAVRQGELNWQPWTPERFAELRAAGYLVDERRVARFEDGIAGHLADHPGVALAMMEPSAHGAAASIQRLVERHGGRLELLPNALWLSSADSFDRWAGSRRSLRMEGWYREMRRRTGWLMEGAEPVGGAWNLDAENRETPPPGTCYPAVPRFVPDPITVETTAWVDATFRDHPGATAGFSWPEPLKTEPPTVGELLHDLMAANGWL
mgnify:CR=1 FL=1